MPKPPPTSGTITRHALLGQPERHGDGAAHREGHLRRRPDRAGRPSPLSSEARTPRGLDRHARHARIAQVRLDDHVGSGEARPDIARAGAAHVRDIVRPVVVDEGRRRRHRGRRRRGDRQRLVRDDHPIEGVGQPIGIVGDHDGDGLAACRTRSPARGGWRWGRPRGSGTSGGTEAVASSGKSSSVHTAVTPVETRGRRAIDAEHAGMGVWAAHQAEVQQIGAAVRSSRYRPRPATRRPSSLRLSEAPICTG